MIWEIVVDKDSFPIPVNLKLDVLMMVGPKIRWGAERKGY